MKKLFAKGGMFPEIESESESEGLYRCNMRGTGAEGTGSYGRISSIMPPIQEAGRI